MPLIVSDKLRRRQPSHALDEGALDPAHMDGWVQGLPTSRRIWAVSNRDSPVNLPITTSATRTT